MSILSKCYVCWSASRSDSWDYGITCGETSNIPRKKKKKLKNFISKYGKYLSNDNFYDGVNLCSIGSDYKKYLKYFRNEHLFKRYEKELTYLFKKEKRSYYTESLFDDICETPSINENFNLELSWENDDEMYSTSGSDSVNWVTDNDDYNFTNSSMDEISHVLFGTSLEKLGITSFKGFLKEMQH